MSTKSDIIWGNCPVRIYLEYMDEKYHIQCERQTITLDELKILSNDLNKFLKQYETYKDNPKNEINFIKLKKE